VRGKLIHRRELGSINELVASEEEEENGKTGG
jgi:hypothetical protein